MFGFLFNFWLIKKLKLVLATFVGAVTIWLTEATLKEDFYWLMV